MMTNKVKPSVLLKDALITLTQCEKSRKYRIDMETWYEPDVDGGKKCSVCLAGSVMALRLGRPEHVHELRSRIPWHYSTEVGRMLGALNQFRLGNVKNGLATMEIKHYNYQVPKRIPVVSYHVSPSLWRDDMEMVIEVLEDAGL